MNFFVGEHYSLGLDFTKSSSVRENLPIISTASELAAFLCISPNQLRWLCFHKRLTTVDHYYRFILTSNSGKKRLIATPKPLMKRCQTRLNEHLLSAASVHEKACAYVSGKSIKDAALPHCNKDIVLRFDIANFFHNVSFSHVKAIFRNLGYNEGVATLLSLLCTTPHVRKRHWDLQDYYFCSIERHLPQGAPTSPTLSNCAMKTTDSILAKIAAKAGGEYTRYADDIFISLPDKSKVGYCISGVRHALDLSGFKLNHRKFRVMSRSRRQLVVGLTVNNRANITRSYRRRFRAFLHQCEKYCVYNYAAEYIRGVLSHVHSVNPYHENKYKQDFPWIEHLPKTSWGCLPKYEPKSIGVAADGGIVAWSTVHKRVVSLESGAPHSKPRTIVRDPQLRKAILRKYQRQVELLA